MASVSRAVCGVQMPCLNGREAPAGRRSVAAPKARNAKRGVIRSVSVSGSGRGQHCAPANAVADAAPITATKRVFPFGKGKSEGNRGMKDLLGGKGANLAEMSSIGLSVPPGFTVSTEACQQYQEAGRALPAGLWAEILDGQLLNTISLR